MKTPHRSSPALLLLAFATAIAPVFAQTAPSGQSAVKPYDAAQQRMA